MMKDTIFILVIGKPGNHFYVCIKIISLLLHIYINKVKVQALNEAAGYYKFCYVFALLCLKELCSFCFHNPLLPFFSL